MKRFPWINIILFILTFLSTLSVGALHEGIDLMEEPSKIYVGLPFSATLMLILLCHESAHYIFSKRHGVEATLPYFIPAPNLFGTLGAVIKMKSKINTRNALIDIGASGPIAGFIISVAASIIGLYLSKVMPVPTKEGIMILGDSLLFLGLSKLIVGQIPANHDVFLHPVALAGWIGFFVTSLNLIPIGQLDGGHIAFALLGEKHLRLSRVLIIVLVILGVAVFEGWLLWAALLYFLIGLKHPPIEYSEIPLDPRRKMLGWITLAIFVLTFMPVPIQIF
ncbi:MAG: site-2 protease family protein [Nitrospirae bacterium]|nr:site-2 protease family protein [Nitrospirota bacterium]